MSKYTADGVDVAEGDSFSAYAATLGQMTHGCSPFVDVYDLSRGHFRGPRGVRFRNLPEDCYFDVAPDGVGTKPILHAVGFTEEGVARDVLAMTGSDITRWGGIPLLFSNVFDVASLGAAGTDLNQRYRRILRGLAAAALEQGIVVYKGETAELGNCVGSDNPNEPMKFNWAGFAMGAYHEPRLITGDTLAHGQRVIALRERGFRSNGISSVRKALLMKFGEEWWANPAARKAIHAAAAPSILYDRFLTELNGWYSSDFNPQVRAHAIIHVTGGGIKSKFGEDILFPRGLSAELDNLWEPPQIMQDCAFWRKMSSVECYEVWNGGQGMLLVVDEADVQTVISLARTHNIEAQECGRITREAAPVVRIRSRFDGKEIVYSAAA